MTISEILTMIAILAGPIIAVIMTFNHEARTRKYQAKERLFITLMAHRKSFPISRDWAQALNLIDVIFEDSPAVVTAWHSFYDYIHIVPMDDKQFEHRHIAILSAMATVLGYLSLQQTDIDKFYNLQTHGDESRRNYEVQNELLRVLKSSKSFSETQ